MATAMWNDLLSELKDKNISRKEVQIGP